MNRRPRREPRPRYNKRKDTRRWCKGKPGVKHVPVMVKVPWSQQMDLKCDTTYIEPGGRHYWGHCWHQIECAVCGKFLFDVNPKDCPDLKDADAGEDKDR